MSGQTGVILRRYGQFLVDRLLATLPAVVVLVAGWHEVTRPPRAGRAVPSYAVLVAFVLVLLIANWVVEVWVPHRWLGGTPGMRLLGLRVVAEESGAAPALRAYTIRWLLMIVDGYLFGLVGAVVIAVSRRHQRVGDMAARTLVVRRG